MMKKVIKYIFSVLVLLSLSCALQAQNEIVYQHPTLGIQFSASPYWSMVNHAGGGLEYELVNKNNNMHVKMWLSDTDKSVVDFLRSEVCENGMISDEGIFVMDLDDHVAYGICANCSEMRRPQKMMLIAMPSDEGLYLIRFKCPEECYSEHKEKIQKLLSTITLNQA